MTMQTLKNTLVYYILSRISIILAISNRTQQVNVEMWGHGNIPKKDVICGKK